MDVTCVQTKRKANFGSADVTEMNVKLGQKKEEKKHTPLMWSYSDEIVKTCEKDGETKLLHQILLNTCQSKPKMADVKVLFFVKS